MMNLRLKPATLNCHFVKKTLQRLYATSIEPIQKDAEDPYEKELKKYDTLKNIVKRTREKKPQREPFVKNLLLGVFDKEILTFPEIDLHECRSVEAEVGKLSKLLKQNHMVNVETISKKTFRQNLADLRAIGLQSSQLLDGRECSPLELLRFLETLSEHRLGDSLLHHEMLGVQTLNEYANENLQKKYLYPVMKGEKICAFAMQEVGLLDIAKMQTKAVLSKDKKYWTLNGTKSFVVNGISADIYVVFAISDIVKFNEEQEIHYTAFLVEKDFQGFSRKKLDPANIELAEINLENVQVPADNVIGEVNGAVNILKAITSNFRLSCGPACNTLSTSMINNLYKSLVESSSSEFDLTSTDAAKSTLGEMCMDLYAADSAAYLTAGLQDWYDGQDVDVESAIVKVISSEVAYNISSSCLNMVGLPATLNNHWARKCHEATLNYLTLHETNENLRMFIAIKGLEHAGIYLSNKIKKLRNPFFHGTYNLIRIFTEHRQNSDNPKLDLELDSYLHPSCKATSKQLEYCVKRLEYATERFLSEHGLECVNRHIGLRALADIMIDCYVMTAVLARASRSYCIGLQFGDYEMALATVYCNMALQRVRHKANSIFTTDLRTDGRNHMAVGKRVVESKGYFVQKATSRFF